MPTALLISRDLFFISKVTGTAASLGIDMRVVADVQAAAQLANAERVQCVFVDLADEGLEIAEYFVGLKSGQPESGVSESARSAPVIAFGSHVATARLDAARDAGCTDVMPRSRFSASLPEVLKQYCGR